MDKLRARKLLATNASKKGYTVQLREGGENQDEIRILNSSRQIIAVGTVRKDKSGYDTADIQGTISQIRAGNFEVRPASMNSSRKSHKRVRMNSSRVPAGWERYYDVVDFGRLGDVVGIPYEYIEEDINAVIKNGYGNPEVALVAKAEYEVTLSEAGLDVLMVLDTGAVGYVESHSRSLAFFGVDIETVEDTLAESMNSCVGANCARKRTRSYSKKLNCSTPYGAEFDDYYDFVPADEAEEYGFDTYDLTNWLDGRRYGNFIGMLLAKPEYENALAGDDMAVLVALDNGAVGYTHGHGNSFRFYTVTLQDVEDVLNFVNENSSRRRTNAGRKANSSSRSSHRSAKKTNASRKTGKRVLGMRQLSNASKK